LLRELQIDAHGRQRLDVGEPPDKKPTTCGDVVAFDQEDRMTTLYYATGACSLAPHIVLEWIGAPYEPGRGRARVAPAEPGLDGWVRPKHGHGMLRPWQPGNKLGGQRPGRFQETQQLARQHSVDAVRTLVERLHDPDGRVAVVAANSLLDRGWGKPREQQPAQQEQVHIDLTRLSDEELGILVRLVQSGRLMNVPVESEETASVIEAKG
jgi:hypothetical protein